MGVYGNLTNRLEEGQVRTVDGLIHVGDDITMYLYSDRMCFHVTRVIDQKHIFVSPYYVCADHSKSGGMGHQDWMYFKTNKEMQEYLRLYFPDTPTPKEEPVPEEEWKLRYNKWRGVKIFTAADFAAEKAALKEHYENDGVKLTEEELIDKTACRFTLDKKLQSKLIEGSDIETYYELSGDVSIGVRDYYYDWEF